MGNEKIQIARRPPGRPRSGLTYASVSVRLESGLWKRVDGVAKARGLTRNAVIRLAMEAGVEAMEAQK